MSNLSSRFTSETNSGAYYAASLRLMAADTRLGITGDAKADFATVKEQAARSPSKPYLAAYVARFENAAGKPAPSRHALGMATTGQM